MRSISRFGFTLIELLIVVAIIAILAAIAVPNFLEAQTRAKVSRVKSDLRTQATALEAYYVDNNSYTRDSDSDLDQTDGVGPQEKRANGAIQLTTPIAYMTSLLQDPFSAAGTQVTGGTAIGYRIGSGTWNYPSGFNATKDVQGADSTLFAATGRVGAWVTLSPGPSKKRSKMGYKAFPFRSPDTANEPEAYIPYDPTNGTVSKGDVYRMGGSFMSGDWEYIVKGGKPAQPAQ